MREVNCNVWTKKLYLWKKHRRQKFAAWADKVESKYEDLLLSEIARAENGQKLLKRCLGNLSKTSIINVLDWMQTKLVFNVIFNQWNVFINWNSQLNWISADAVVTTGLQTVTKEMYMYYIYIYIYKTLKTFD